MGATYGGFDERQTLRNISLTLVTAAEDVEDAGRATSAKTSILDRSSGGGNRGGKTR